jgi:hypothetical protein
MNGKAAASSSFANDIAPLFTPAQKRCMAAQGDAGRFAS